MYYASTQRISLKYQRLLRRQEEATGCGLRQRAHILIFLSCGLSLLVVRAGWMDCDAITMP
jgi:hypothetical protein